MIIRIVIFLILNFAALGIGGLFTSKGVPSDWYMHLNKAPWTPPGWCFGVAWTLIMIFLAFYMAKLWPSVENKKLLISLYAIQWGLNVLWNPVFFYYQNAFLGLILVSLLTILMGFILIYYYPLVTIKSWFILPYFIWLLVATSLNLFIVIKN